MAVNCSNCDYPAKDTGSARCTECGLTPREARRKLDGERRLLQTATAMGMISAFGGIAIVCVTRYYVEANDPWFILPVEVQQRAWVGAVAAMSVTSLLAVGAAVALFAAIDRAVWASPIWRRVVAGTGVLLAMTIQGGAWWMLVGSTRFWDS